ncbi:MAG: hypothetical protein HYU41_00070 [Candidatus Rokubacteria bacterium]|nr:hypothetical protein [Candidatus Rokubacteria bacterium]
MLSVAGIFTDRESAERAATALRAPEIAGHHVTTLAPGTTAAEAAAQTPTAEGEQPAGLGRTIGTVVGAAAGATGGMHVALAAAVTVFPLVGPVIVTGMLAGLLVGATVGGAIGKALETHLPTGMPKDELVVYEEALRRGRSVVIALVESDEQARAAREMLDRAGAESVDAARRSWRVGLTDESGRSAA